MEGLRDWFLKNKRVFPWREDPSPYRVWISEVMLQQTRAAVVVEYFNRWMAKFPTVESLANACEADVIKLWEGLGYYARARNLHQGARFVIDHFNWKIPSTYQELLTIKGLGPYTAGAILSFAFHKKAPALDGNVMRVLSRFLGFAKDVQKHKKELTEHLRGLLPDKDPHVVMEALIELGALICAKTPKCEVCPLQATCKAYAENTVELLPIKTKKPPIQTLHRAVLCITCEERVLLKLNPKGAIMADLWEFPYIECDDEPLLSQVKKKSIGDLEIDFDSPLKGVIHHFTRYKCHLYPYRFTAKECVDVTGYQWISLEEIGSLPFSSGHKKVFINLSLP